jgi:hypothetical protein
VPVLVFTGLGLAVGIQGIILLTFRYFIVLNDTLRQAVITRQFGPLNICSVRNLSGYQLISITDDCDPELTASAATTVPRRIHARAPPRAKTRTTMQTNSAARSSFQHAIMSARSLAPTSDPS